MKAEAKTASFPSVPKHAVTVAGTAKVRVKRASGFVSAGRATASDGQRVGSVAAETMRDVDKLALAPVVKFGAREIAALRARERVSQPVFAMYLNVSKSSVCQWESGEKHPDGAALKLLNIVSRKGLEVLA